MFPPSLPHQRSVPPAAPWREIRMRLGGRGGQRHMTLPPAQFLVGTPHRLWKFRANDSFVPLRRWPYTSSLLPPAPPRARIRGSADNRVGRSHLPGNDRTTPHYPCSNCTSRDEHLRASSASPSPLPFSSVRHRPSGRAFSFPTSSSGDLAIPAN